MNTQEITELNRATLETIRERKKHPDAAPQALLPFFGYIDVELDGCPPFVLFSNNDSPVVQYFLEDGEFEKQSMKVWCRLCKVAGGIVDIGANVGVYSLVAASLRPDIPIHAFEPNPYAFARLRMHKEINKLPNIVEHAAAVGHKSAMIELSWAIKPGGNISSGATIMKAPRVSRKTEEIPVRIVSLDNLQLATGLGDRPLMKIDVEGAEALVYQGMSSVLALKPDIILETFHTANADAITDLLKPLGYRFYRILEAQGALEMTDRLIACDPKSLHHDFNQLMTTRTAEDIESLMS